jgi:hypothetical protein
MIIFMPKLSADCTPGAMLCALGYALPLPCIEGRSNVIDCILKRFAHRQRKKFLLVCTRLQISLVKEQTFSNQRGDYCAG